MNYSLAFTTAARIEDAYNGAQDWIANEAPVIEQRIKDIALKSVVYVCTTLLFLIDYLSDRLPVAIIYVKLYRVRAAKRLVRLAIALVELNQRYGFTAKVARTWRCRGVLTRSALDRIFCLV